MGHGLPTREGKKKDSSNKDEEARDMILATLK